MQSKIYLFVPQWESRGPAKSNLSSPLVSSKEQNLLICDLEIMLFIFLPSLYILDNLCPESKFVC